LSAHIPKHEYEKGTSNTISFLRSVEIELTTTNPYIPEQNMIKERVWRTIGESSIAMLLIAALAGSLEYSLLSLQ